MIGITILIFIGSAVAGIVIFVGLAALRQQFMMGRRKYRALKSGAPHTSIMGREYQPLTTNAAWREPLEFEATNACPHCGFFNTHSMSEPRPDVFNFQKNEDGEYRLMAFAPWIKRPMLGDHPGAVTKRNCKFCGHIWGEK